MLGIISCTQVQEKISLQEEDAKIKAMLKGFYTFYITEMASSNDLKLSGERLDSIARKHSTVALYNKIPEIIKATDSDPYLYAQDSNIDCLKTLTIVKDPRNDNRYVVSYTDIYSDPKTDFKIYLGVIKENNEYKINSIEYK